MLYIPWRSFNVWLKGSNMLTFQVLSVNYTGILVEFSSIQWNMAHRFQDLKYTKRYYHGWVIKYVQHQGVSKNGDSPIGLDGDITKMLS